MIKSQKYKLYSNKNNKLVHQLIDISGIVWNHCIALQKRYYKIYGKYISLSRLQSHIAKVRRNNETFQILNSQTVQEICKRVDQAYKRFFDKLAKRPPTFKRVKQFKSFVFKQSGFKLQDNVLRINNLKKNFKFSKSRDYENVRRIRIKRDSLGDLWLIITVNTEPEKYKREGNSSIGIDFGLKTYLTLSNGETHKSARVYKQFEPELKEKHKALSNKKKGSNNRKKAKRDLARVYRRMKYKREDTEWKLAHELCKKYAFIALEDLNIEAMKSRWGKKVSDLSFSSFVHKLKHVAKKYDTVVHEIDRWYPSTKTCSKCGNKQDMKLSEREFVCHHCGHTDSRDINAAKNILSEGIRSYCTKHKTSLEAT